MQRVRTMEREGTGTSQANGTKPYDHTFQRTLESMFKRNDFEQEASRLTTSAILGLSEEASLFLWPAMGETVEVVL